MDTNTTQKLEQDVSFLREVVRRRNQGLYGPAAIVVLWAVVIGVGFTLNDFCHQAASWFWLIAPVLGFLASLWIGHRAEGRIGVAERGEMWKHGLHWGSIFVACAGVLSIAWAHGFAKGEIVGQLFVLISGTILFLGGLHLERRFLWPGVLLVVGSAAIDYVEPYPWTIVGLTIGASLIASALWMKPKNVEAKATA